jgi:trafficking protein particle complex subunit 6
MSFEAVMPPYNAGDPTATFLSASCLDFLLIELVPMAYRVTNELEASSASSAPGAGTSAAAAADKDTSVAPRAAMDEEEERDAVFYRLETLGYRVGQGLVERYVFLSFFLSSVLPKG